MSTTQNFSFHSLHHCIPTSVGLSFHTRITFKGVPFLLVRETFHFIAKVKCLAHGNYFSLKHPTNKFEKTYHHLLTINPSMNPLCHFFPIHKLFFPLLRNIIFLDWSINPYPSQPLTRGLPSFRTSRSPPFLPLSSLSNPSTFCNLRFANCPSSTTPRSTRCDHMTIFNDTPSNTVCICITRNLTIVGM